MPINSESAHLPEGVRDRILKELAPVLGFDFWTLDEVVKEDAARELAYVLDLEGERARADESIDTLEETIKSWRDTVCALFGVSQETRTEGKRGKVSYVPKSDEVLFGELEQARDAHLSRTAGLEGVVARVCDSLGVERRVAEGPEDLAEVLEDWMHRLRTVAGAPPRATKDQILEAIEATRAELEPVGLDPDTIRAMGLPADADRARIRARIESLLRAERDLTADFLAKGALL